MTDKNEIIKSEKGSIDLSKMHELDLHGLNKEQKENALAKLSDAKIDLAKKAHQAKTDLQATKIALDDMTSAVKEASDTGTSATITHTQTTSIGRTEIIMGNTERAARGKISRSGAGLDDNLMKIIIVAGIFGVIIAMIAG